VLREERTADVIAKTLTDWGIPVHRGQGKTGVVGIVKNATAAAAPALGTLFLFDAADSGATTSP